MESLVCRLSVAYPGLSLFIEPAVVMNGLSAPAPAVTPAVAISATTSAVSTKVQPVLRLVPAVLISQHYD